MILNFCKMHLNIWIRTQLSLDFKDPSTMAIANKFKRSGLITHADEFDSSHLQFAAPLVRIILWQHMYTSRLSFIRANTNFDAFLCLSIERMRPSALHTSLSHGIKKNSRLLERAWQMEWSFAA